MNFEIGNQDTFSLNDYIVKNAPMRAIYIPEFVTKYEEESLIQNVYLSPKPKWTQLLNRRLQNWGGVPHEKGMIAEKMPVWLDPLLSTINDLNVMSENVPNHILVNEYLPGQGIMPHLDGSLFYPTICTISCGSHIVLNFYDQETKTMPNFSFLLEQRSLLILQEEMFSDYLHSIEEKEADTISENMLNLSKCSNTYKLGDILERNTRISFTIRHVPKTSKLKIRLSK